MPTSSPADRRTRNFAIAAAAVVLLGLTLGAAYVWLRAPTDRFAQCRASVIAGGAGAIGGPFALTDLATGRTIPDSEIFARPGFLYFGYTFCPDVCPFDTVRNAEAAELLAERGHDVASVFVSVDPARDTPEVLADFAANISPRMIALSGTPDEVRAAAQAYRVYYKAQPAKDDYYLVDHSTFTYLVLPGYGFVEFFRRETSAEAMADAAACFLEAM
jgi:protein SCO1/2